jgi:hypothetical protein
MLFFQSIKFFLGFRPHFPDFPLSEVIPQYLERSKIEGRNKIMKAFRAWVGTRIGEIEAQ